jgi:hypothetical protein
MMSIRTLRLGLGLLFLGLGIAIFTRQWFFPELAARYDTLRMNLGGVFALVFAGLNLARWYAATQFVKSRQIAVHYPLQRDPSASPQVEPVPEFDFFKQKDEAKDEEEKKQL